MSDKNMFDAAIRSIAKDDSATNQKLLLLKNAEVMELKQDNRLLKQKLLEANAHIERLSDQRTLDVRMKEAGMITLTEIWSGLPIDDFIKTNKVTTLEYFGRWLESRYKEASTMFAKRTVSKQEDDELYEWVLAHNAVFKEVLLNFNQVKQSPAQHTAEHDAEVARRNK